MDEEAGPRQTAGVPVRPDLGLLALRAVRNEDLWFTSLLVYGILLEHPKRTRTCPKQAFGNSPSLEEETPFSLLQGCFSEVPM